MEGTLSEDLKGELYHILYYLGTFAEYADLGKLSGFCVRLKKPRTSNYQRQQWFENFSIVPNDKAVAWPLPLPFEANGKKEIKQENRFPVMFERLKELILRYPQEHQGALAEAMSAYLFVFVWRTDGSFPRPVDAPPSGTQPGHGLGESSDAFVSDQNGGVEGIVRDLANVAVTTPTFQTFEARFGGLPQGIFRYLARSFLVDESGVPVVGEVDIPEDV